VRGKIIFRPGSGGLVTDVPSTFIKGEAMSYAQDATFYRGAMQQRQGWAYENAYGAPASGTPVGVMRAQFSRANAKRTVASMADGSVWLNVGSGVSVDLGAPVRAQSPIPRCVYRDEVIFCYADGVTPILRYSGIPNGGFSVTDPTPPTLAYTQNQATVTIGGSVTFSSAPAAGSYMPIVLGGVIATWARVLPGATTTSATVEDITHISAPASSYASGKIYNSGATAGSWPCQMIYNDGTATVTTITTTGTPSGVTATATGFGTNWSDSLMPYSGRAAILYKDGDLWKLRSISNFGTGDPVANVPTTMTLASSPIVFSSAGGGGGIGTASFTGTSVTTTTTKGPYQILSSPTWSDACVHKGSLWGTGVKYHPNRVYVAPPNWNPALPPGEVYPYDVSTVLAKASFDNWLLDFIDVPTSYDGDPVVAILSSPGPLLVLKRSAVHGIYGTYPTFEQSLIQSGVGCIDRRAAITVESTPFWAGEDGVFSFAGGRIQSLVRNKIEREWQALMNGWQQGTSYCVLGVVANHLIVTVGGLNNAGTTGAKVGPDVDNPTQRTLVYDLAGGEWVSRFSNIPAKAYHSARVPGEVEALLFVGDSDGKIGDLAPAITGSKITNRDSQTVAAASPVDGNGTEPQMETWTSLGLAEAAGLDGDARLVDLSVVTNVHDTVASATTLNVSVAQTEGLRPPAAGETPVTVGTVSSDTTDAVNRNRYRVARSGRTHQLRLKTNTTAATCKKIEVQEAVLNFRDSRKRT
jgi:hypothetical protein